MNKPDLIYKFMQLAKHNSMWTLDTVYKYYGVGSLKKLTAGRGVRIFQDCQAGTRAAATTFGRAHPAPLPVRSCDAYAAASDVSSFKFDPSASVQASMSNIWDSIVEEPQKAVDKYFPQILQVLADRFCERG